MIPDLMQISFSPYSVSDLKAVCEKYRLRPSKDRGQNFLIDERVADTMVSAAGLAPGSQCLEIGPGLGALTFKLAEQGVQLYALEIESKLVKFLREELEIRNLKNVVIAEGDALQLLSQEKCKSAKVQKYEDDADCALPHLSFPTFTPSPERYVRNAVDERRINRKNTDQCYGRKPMVTGFTHSTLMASLPYSITGDFFSLLFSMAFPFARAVLLLQKEVAMRLVAKPPHMSIMGILAQWHAEAAVVQKVPPSAFWPQPEVESAIVVLHAKKEGINKATTNGLNTVFPLIKRAFQAPRKKIKTTLARFNLDKAVDLGLLDKRPSELDLNDWIRLGEVLTKW